MNYDEADRQDPKVNRTAKMLEQRALDRFPEHPFEQGMNAENAFAVMRNYYGMSQAFPFLQAGVQKEHIFRCINDDVPIDHAVEVTSVAAAYLVWDEMGGNQLLSKRGIAGLPDILQTDRTFHANLLRQDLGKMFGREVSPDYSVVTKEYLLALYAQLADPDPVRRCAAMVAFETHAGRMIAALWRSISRLFRIPQDTLIYFRVHVGGANPAEVYHVALTTRMIEELAPVHHLDRFTKSFDEAYASNIKWCEAITQLKN